MDRKKLKARFEQEMELARQAELQGRQEAAFAHLERAHILGQRWLLRHLRSHFQMLRLAMASNDTREISGQIQRILGTPFAWIIGWVPKGNSGGANISPLMPMPLPADMAADLAEFSVRSDMCTRIIMISIGVVIAYIGTT